MIRNHIQFSSIKTTSISLVLLFVILSAYALPLTAKETLTLGMFPRRSSTETLKMFLPLVNHLNKKLNVKIRLVTSKDFSTFWERLEKKQFDIVHFNQYHYVKAHKELAYDVFAVNEEFGESTITGSIIVRKDSGINSIQDLKGKHVVFGGGKMAMQSYIYATYLLMEQGLSPGDYTNSIARTPPNAIFATFYKQADAGGVGDKVLKLRNVEKHIDTSQIKFLARGKQYPHLPWAFKNTLAPDIKQKIVETLIGLKNTTDGNALLTRANLTGFVAVSDKDFDPHRKIIFKVLGIQY